MRQKTCLSGGYATIAILSHLVHPPKLCLVRKTAFVCLMYITAIFVVNIISLILFSKLLTWVFSSESKRHMQSESVAFVDAFEADGVSMKLEHKLLLSLIMEQLIFIALYFLKGDNCPDFDDRFMDMTFCKGQTSFTRWFEGWKSTCQEPLTLFVSARDEWLFWSVLHSKPN